mgnify:CR=1 FL=1
MLAKNPWPELLYQLNAVFLSHGLTLCSICYFFCSTVKNKFGYDDTADVFGIHGVGGIMGAILVGVFVNPALGGAGIVDYSTADFAAGYAGTATQVFAQLKGVVVTVLWCGIVSIILFKIVDMIVGLRVPVEASVAAIFCPISPALPIPLTITLPREA